MTRPSERATHSLVKALGQVPGFDLLSHDYLLRIVGASTNLLWPQGAVVFEQGSPAEALYVLLSGQVKVYERGANGLVEVATIEPGDYFGEMSLLRNSTHTKTAIASHDSELLVLPKDSFERLLRANPDMEALVRRRLEQRQAALGHLQTEVPSGR